PGTPTAHRRPPAACQGPPAARRGPPAACQGPPAARRKENKTYLKSTNIH
ncbi:unnamed protein product, partial [Rotaria sp. Silwood1]